MFSDVSLKTCQVWRPPAEDNLRLKTLVLYQISSVTLIGPRLVWVVP